MEADRTTSSAGAVPAGGARVWARRVRTWSARSAALAVGSLVLAEVILQLPPVRELIRAKAEGALQSRIPGATIDSCAAADVTGVVRFDGVRLPAGTRAELELDGLSISPDLGALLKGRLVPSRIRAADFQARLHVPMLGDVVWGAAPGTMLPVSVVPPDDGVSHPGAPGAVTRLRVQGTSRLCRVSATHDEKGVNPAPCVLGGTFLEAELDRTAADLDAIRFQAVGDAVEISPRPSPGEAAGDADRQRFALPPMAVHGEIRRPRRPGLLELDAELSVGPHGVVALAGNLQEGQFRFVVECATEAYADLVESLPVGLDEVRALGVDGPVRATASVAGTVADPAAWKIQTTLDLEPLRALSARGSASRLEERGGAERRAGSPPGGRMADQGRIDLRQPFLYRPTADPDAAQIWMGDRNPDYMPLESIPDLVVRAVLLSEDSYFWTHPGFDSDAIVNALRSNLREGELHRGGSTISQQLAKNLWLSRDRTFRRKFDEALLTIALEAALPKERILEIYLNGIEWGPGIYGVKNAARHYFGKDPSALEVKEAAFLATIIPNPRRYYGYFRKGKLTETWRNQVMSLAAKMRDSGDITEEEYVEADWTPLRFTSSNDDPWTEEVESPTRVPIELDRRAHPGR